MSRLETHLERAREFRKAADRLADPGARVEMWFLSAYHFIEACAAKHRLHIQKHQRVPDELERNPTILGDETKRVSEAFHYLDHEARARFVYGGSGTEADLEKARKSFELVVSACEAILR